MNTSKIRIKMGQIEVECEGSEQFIKKELPDLLQSVTRLYEQSGGDIRNDSSNGNGTPNPSANSRKILGTTATIAGKLKAKTAKELMIAAAAQLTLVEGKLEFSRQELLTNVKSASGYYKESMSKNFTNYLQGLVKDGELMEPRSGYYALSAETKEQLETKLVT